MIEKIALYERRFTNWLVAMNGIFLAAYESFQTVQNLIPVKWAHGIALGCLIAIGLARIAKQVVAQIAPS